MRGPMRRAMQGRVGQPARGQGQSLRLWAQLLALASTHNSQQEPRRGNTSSSPTHSSSQPLGLQLPTWQQARRTAAMRL